MKKIKTHDSFPARIVFLSNLVTILIYAIGAFILAGLGLLFAILYLFYCLWAEIKILKRSCVNCYYYGKICGFGKGKLCSFFFKKGKPENFVKRKISIKDILPDFLVFIFPLIGGLILLIKDFNWFLVALLVILVILSFGGNAVVRGSFTCKYCKQRELGCPAEKLFRKKRK